ncbi:hypothetical protein Vadar_012934 [Vaccinium darrowii]|uniref:Uncharacterized protein n=1 Tax=Vaccinium darrowii TaxID=229202 RepID=A0ACB7YW36_9ERIC|nr:hypothetical protein Vadar_012934 [Vaccinium darrowii]
MENQNSKSALALPVFQLRSTVREDDRRRRTRSRKKIDEEGEKKGVRNEVLGLVLEDSSWVSPDWRFNGVVHDQIWLLCMIK